VPKRGEKGRPRGKWRGIRSGRRSFRPRIETEKVYVLTDRLCVVDETDKVKGVKKPFVSEVVKQSST